MTKDPRLPPMCLPGASPYDLTCIRGPISVGPGLGGAYGALCYSDGPSTADFVLPENGDVTVPLVLN
jgi:hypothetical protein